MNNLMEWLTDFLLRHIVNHAVVCEKMKKDKG